MVVPVAHRVAQSSVMNGELAGEVGALLPLGPEGPFLTAIDEILDLSDRDFSRTISSSPCAVYAQIAARLD